MDKNIASYSDNHVRQNYVREIKRMCILDYCVLM